MMQMHHPAAEPGNLAVSLAPLAAWLQLELHAAAAAKLGGGLAPRRKQQSGGAGKREMLAGGQ
jgi:hypothetical protein